MSEQMTLDGAFEIISKLLILFIFTAGIVAYSYRVEINNYMLTIDGWCTGCEVVE